MRRNTSNVKLISFLTFTFVIAGCILLFASFVREVVNVRPQQVNASLDMSVGPGIEVETGDSSSFGLYDDPNKKNGVELDPSDKGGVKIKGKFYCQCDPRFEDVNGLCNFGCGITSLANISLKLNKKFDPQDIVAFAQKYPPTIWVSNVGFYPSNFINDHVEKLGFKYSGVNLVTSGGVDLSKAKKFLDKGYLILCSSHAEYHVFTMTGICGENCIEVMDSWKGCQQNQGGNTTDNPVILQKPRSYCDNYAYPLK